MPVRLKETDITETEEETCVCSNCGREYPEGEGAHFDDQDLCQDCLEELTSVCSRCGERIWNDSNVGNSEIVLCQSCYDNYYTTCEGCGEIICLDDTYHIDDDEEAAYCYSCYSQHRNEQKTIHSYSYKPEPLFYPEYNSDSLFLGVELEIDEGGEDPGNAKEILGVANQREECLYIKHDGSLHDGLELVSHPCTLDYHMNRVPWREICDKSVSLGYTSHMANTAGLHVHISRLALGNTYQKQEEVIARILYFVEAHFNEMLRFSRRTEAQLNRWAARYGFKEHPKDILDHAKNSSFGRYTAVNLLNSNTIEFRIFRGTLKYTSFIAALQIVSEICGAAISMSDEEFRGMTWNEFVLRIDRDKYPELIGYLKCRRLYVNEEVASGEEV